MKGYEVELKFSAAVQISTETSKLHQINDRVKKDIRLVIHRSQT